MDHLRWAGRYILEKKPDVIVHLGDHWDFPSLSSYDKGKRQFEGRRVKDDVQAGNTGLRLLDEPTVDANRKRKKPYTPEKHLLRGNHENRWERFLDDHPEFEGVIELDDRDWRVHDFLEPVCLQGVSYSHYWYNPMSGRPYSAMAATRLKQIGHTFVMGHQQTYDVAVRFVGNKAHRAVIAGSFYLHDEDYKGPQGNAHWRGILMFHEVNEGDFNIMEVSIDYLCRRYEGVGVGEFLRETYPDHSGSLWRV